MGSDKHTQDDQELVAYEEQGHYQHSSKIYLYAWLPCAGGLAFGYDTGSMSGILAMSQFLDYMKHPSNFTQGGITASIQAGAFVGSLATGAFLADRYGRKKTILIGSAIFTAGIAISTAANGVACLVAGRVINGLGNGCLAMMVPLYQSEIAPASIRGRVISMQQCFINLGILLAFWIQYGCSHINSTAAWRVPIGLQMTFTIFLHCVMYFLPESPRWLAQKDRFGDAQKSLARLHADGDESKPIVIAEIAEIRAKLEWEKRNPAPSYGIMLFGSERRRTYLGIGVQFMQQVTGINVIMYYAVFLFQQAGISGTKSALLANGIQGVVLNVFTWPNMYWMDTWGRRRPMIIGAIGQGIALMAIAILMSTKGDPYYDAETKKTNFNFTNKSDSNATIAFVYIYVFFFAITWACVAWVYPNEVFSMNMRGKGTSMSSATNWFVNFWFALYIPTAMGKISWKLYIIFMALCYAMAIVVYLFFPESARKSLEEMDFLFEESRTIFVFRDKSATKVGALVPRNLAAGGAITDFGDRKKSVAETVETLHPEQ